MRFKLLPALLLLALSLPVSQLSAQCALVCKGSVNVSLGANGTAVITPPMLLQSSAGCSNNFDIDVTDTLGNHYGNTVNAALLGKPLSAKITHPASGNSCNTAITVIDLLPPVFVCTDTLFIWCNQPSAPANIGTPAVSDNATPTANINLQNSDVFTDLDCFVMVGGVAVTAKITRTWTATDASGNSATCIQHIYQRRATLDMVVFPKHRDGVQAPALECAVNDPNNLALTGQPQIDTFILNNTFNCELITSHTDQSIPICGGSRKIIRTWTVFDLCTDDFKVFSQIIRVNDTQKPAITCPGNVSFTAYISACSAQVFLPQANATDACGTATVTTSWQYGSGYGPFNTVPVGSYTVTYTAKDECNNTATCQISVTVKDETKPTALCQNSVNVTLQADGTALVFATTFNNGSYDNCGIDYLHANRNNEPFDEFVAFDCSDVGKSIQVKLKVVDKSGLENQCTANVSVKDDIKPNILCPATTTVGCGDNYNNTSQTGLPYATDNCGLASTTYTNQINLNSCGIGTVMRTWKATDGSGNFATCQQTINVKDNTSITVTFPQDILTYQCQPNTDPSVTGMPVVIGKDCEQLQITNTDYMFYTAEPACFQLIRKWAIINWCVYQPNDPNNTGFWEHTQVIEVRDSLAPVLTCPANLTVGIQNTSCQAFADVPLPSVNDCSNQLVITNNSPYAQSPNGSAKGVYPKGVHTITYTVSDGCGNTSQCSTKLTIADTQAPNPICNNGVSVTIQQNGSVTLTPATINNGSFDNCSPASKLVLQVSPNTFNCQSVGSKTVMLTVTDEAGNSAFCNTLVNVQDNFNICNNQTTVTIAGKLLRENGDPVAQKIVGLTGGLAVAGQTNADGTFAFPNLPLGQSYTITPSYNTKPLNGVSTYDLVLIRRHILGVEPFTSPYKLIAADVNKSGGVSTLDLVELQKMVLNVNTQFPNNTPSWRFVPANHVFQTPSNPFNPPFPESISFPNVEISQWEQNFVAVKIGDVNNSATTNSIGGDATGDRSFDNNLIFKTTDIKLAAGYDYVIPFRAKDFRRVAGFQFTIDFDETAMDFTGMVPGALAFLKERNIGATLAGAGSLTISWDNMTDQELNDDETLFSLKFSAKKNTQLSEVLAFNSSITPAEAYGGRVNDRDASFEFLGITLEFDEAVTGRFRLFQNTPNPFSKTTKISFYLPEATQVALRIYDVYGKLLKTYEGAYSAGTHEIEVNEKDISQRGILLAELHAQGKRRQTIRMLMIDN